ncbi:MAG: UDP-N-acetylmuramoyl-tripeptide--D-alanyl-D-alanine ligase [Chitinophagaceae bacterium]
MNIEKLYELFLMNPSVTTDTRKIKPGDLFFALKGPTFNGNAFAHKAINDGAEFAIIDEPEYTLPQKTVLVADVLTTLQELARFHRLTFNIPFIAITGSNGKTTTKELVHTVLSSRFKTFTTEGNMNNQIGIPLTLLRVKKDAEMAVIEMGANHQGEIESYCRYTIPTHGIITNAGKAHLEGFGGIEGVKKGKGELFNFICGHKGTAFVMWDYDYLREMSTGIAEVIKYGRIDGDIVGDIKQSDPYLEVSISKGADLTSIQTQLVGDYNLPNVLAAVTVGKYFKVADRFIKNAIEAYAPSNSRSQMIEKDSNKIILDAYNANPSSMKSALENFAKLQGTDKILILGAMAELGHESLEEHKSIIQLIDKYPWKYVVLVGGDFLKTPHPYMSFTNSGEAAKWYSQQHFTNSQLLIKGSRSMQMERILQ